MPRSVSRDRRLGTWDNRSLHSEKSPGYKSERNYSCKELRSVIKEQRNNLRRRKNETCSIVSVCAAGRSPRLHPYCSVGSGSWSSSTEGY